MIKVASYNMRKGIGTDRRRRPERILDVLHEIDADIVCLQEADRRFGSKASAIPLAMLDAHSDYKAVELDIRAGSIGWHGNALLVRKQVEVLEHHLFHLPSLEPRGAVLADVVVDGAILRCVGMHLDLSGLWRRQQARAAVLRVAGGLSLLTPPRETPPATAPSTAGTRARSSSRCRSPRRRRPA